MSRSITEKDLFQNNEDKEHYLMLLLRYKKKYHYKIYSYCLMDNHVHLFINPEGFDISTIMQSLNTAYVRYFNKRYNRHGSLFQGRFASTVVNSDKYALALFAYIHNNPRDMTEFTGREEFYPYSSYGIYTGQLMDKLGIVDSEFMLMFFGSNYSVARHNCISFTRIMKNSENINKVDDDIIRAYTENEYKDEKKCVVRYNKPDELIKNIEVILNGTIVAPLRAKYMRRASETRAFTTYVMRALCGLSYRNICEFIGNISISGVTRLTNEGFNLVINQRKYHEAFNLLIKVA
jgi:Transposase and inactivated derivatives